jgi:transcriptional regulator with GAF, ATPase, and Fis domain
MSANEDVEPSEITLQVEEVDRVELADTLRDLGEQLQRAADFMYNRKQESQMRERYAHGDIPNEYEQLELEAKDAEEFRRALTTLREFRRQYGRWERVIAEYSLAKMNYSQRDAAKYLGVGVSTVNRWAQHPLTLDDPH